MSDQMIQTATQAIQRILEDSLRMQSTETVVVIFDTEAPLARILTEGYRNALPQGRFIDFANSSPAEILALFNQLQPGDAVILVQSTNFRLNEFRIRIELFHRGLKTIEHIHLGRMLESEFPTYLEALSYGPAYFHPIADPLKERIDQAREIVVECGEARLVFPGGMEEARLNIGDYTGMKNVGGLYPIGEVFTEAKDIEAVQGSLRIFGFAGQDHVVRFYEPFLATVESGILSAPDAPGEFQEILDLIRVNEPVWVRELGFGLNPAMGRHQRVADISAFERQRGIHLSLGAKHATYPKPGFKRKEGRYHVDIFVDVTCVRIDGAVVSW